MRTLLSIIQENGTGINSKKNRQQFVRIAYNRILDQLWFLWYNTKERALALHLAAAGFKIGKVNGK